MVWEHDIILLDCFLGMTLSLLTFLPFSYSMGSPDQLKDSLGYKWSSIICFYHDVRSTSSLLFCIIHVIRGKPQYDARVLYQQSYELT